MERESIITSLRTKLRTTPGVAVVTRNLRKAATVTECPAIFIMDLGDDEAQATSGARSKQNMNLGFGVIYKGTTEEKAAEEMSAFRQQILKVLFGVDGNRKVDDTYGGLLFEAGLSQLYFPKDMASTIVGQVMHFTVLYSRDLTRIS